MRESCSCGAGIHTIHYRRVLTWRLTHLHGDPEVHDIESETSFPTGFTIEAEDEEED